MKIGIAITTRNRPGVLCHTLKMMYDYLPDNAKIVIVDDGSIYALPIMADSYCNTFRFNENVGVSAAKNKCLELLEDCEHVFLFDDDCYPIVDGWEQYYINSPLKHACWTFGRKELSCKQDEYIEFEKPCGCMLYFTKECIDKVGGWDVSFKGYGYEHCNLSDRIFNNGLTPVRYPDVSIKPECGWFDVKLFEIADCESSFTSIDRSRIPDNYALYQQNFNSKEFKPFK